MSHSPEFSYIAQHQLHFFDILSSLSLKALENGDKMIEE